MSFFSSRHRASLELLQGNIAFDIIDIVLLYESQLYPKWA